MKNNKIMLIFGILSLAMAILYLYFSYGYKYLFKEIGVLTIILFTIFCILFILSDIKICNVQFTKEEYEKKMRELGVEK